MKSTEGAFVRWGHELAATEFAEATPTNFVVDDIIADNAFQQLLLNPSQFDVLATTNLNGDYLSDAVAAQVGGIGIAPGANINYETGMAVFEATHGTAPNIAGLGIANPASLILSGAMMFEHLGHPGASDAIVRAVELTIADGVVTSDLARGGDGLSTMAFGEAVASRLT